VDAAALVDLAPIARVALVGVSVALVPLAWLGWRHRGATPAQRWRRLTLLALFLTFDLVLFGAFTRLTDSGLGCPDWPGCYGSASPMGARQEIQAAQTVQPSGPVTHGKAWIEMVHRYLATAVGVLITVLAVGSWRDARRGWLPVSPWWATVTLVWVCLQGAFGALTVTWKLYPAIVTAHLLGGVALLSLLAIQAEGYRRETLRLPARLWAASIAVGLLTLWQVALGGWVSTNYAVLACTDFPTCQGLWWPEMDFGHGFSLLRELGERHDGGFLPFAALTAIHVAHRLGAAVLLVAVALLAWQLHTCGEPSLRRWAWALVGVVSWQLVSGLSNVVFDWPLLAAVAHTGGAAALVVLLTVLLARAALGRLGPVAPARPQWRGTRSS
jgi:cytochrome c oxidase assembly protein subunit 15